MDGLERRERDCWLIDLSLNSYHLIRNVCIGINNGALKEGQVTNYENCSFLPVAQCLGLKMVVLI